MRKARVIRGRIGQVDESQLLYVAQPLEFRRVDDSVQRMVDINSVVDNLKNKLFNFFQLFSETNNLQLTSLICVNLDLLLLSLVHSFFAVLIISEKAGPIISRKQFK